MRAAQRQTEVFAMDRRYSFYPVEQDHGYGDSVSTDENDEQNTG